VGKTIGMLWTPFKKVPKKCLGIDIGTSYIKMVEIRKRGKDKELSNYGEIKVSDIYPNFKASIITAEIEEVANVIGAIIAEAKIKTRTAVFSLPDYSSFFTTFTLPAMTKEEIPEAVKYEAPLHIPLPLTKVTLDWQVVEGFEKQGVPLEILLVAVPNEIVNRYREIASLAKLNLEALEAEVFGLIRSLIKSDLTTALVDIGAESTTCSIVDKKILKSSHSFDTGGKRLTEALAGLLNVEWERAEKLKIENGILGVKSVREGLLPTLNLILKETEQICSEFSETERKEVENLILAGGSALLPGLKEYFAENINLPKFPKEKFGQVNKKVEIADPFSGLISPPVLSKNLGEMGPLYAVSVGIALRGIQ